MLRKTVDALYGSYVAALIVAVFVAFAPIVLLCPGQRRRRSAVGLAVRSVLLLGGIRIRVEGLSNLPETTCMAIANHASYVDGPLLMGLLPPRFTFVVHDGIERIPIIGWIVARAGCSYISRTEPRRAAAQTRALARRLRDGESLLVFPEGGFEREPGLREFKRGAFRMAASAELPIVPIAVDGTRRLFGGGRWLPRRAALHICVLEPASASADVEAQRTLLRARMVAALPEGDALVDQAGMVAASVTTADVSSP